ncbi:hypothetical protein CL619_02245 [archaeon]|nr:hypothetical protein [archaeon]|tara:strand:- start:376 stop:855 length:480 start_codon:yes stop_codon:yes gene_type:complete
MKFEQKLIVGVGAASILLNVFQAYNAIESEQESSTRYNEAVAEGLNFKPKALYCSLGSFLKLDEIGIYDGTDESLDPKIVQDISCVVYDVEGRETNFDSSGELTLGLRAHYGNFVSGTPHILAFGSPASDLDHNSEKAKIARTQYIVHNFHVGRTNGAE